MCIRDRDYGDMIHIDGDYENGGDAFHYDIYLRPWGTYWAVSYTHRLRGRPIYPPGQIYPVRSEAGDLEGLGRVR